MNHDAIYIAYPAAAYIDDGAGVFDKNGNKIEIDLAAVARAESELNAKKSLEEARFSREAAYRTESDPLFFKAQRGEAAMSEWTAKVQEIRLRFPY